MIVPLGRPSYGAASSRCMRSLRCIGSFGRTNDLTSFKKWVNLSPYTAADSTDRRNRADRAQLERETQTGVRCVPQVPVPKDDTPASEAVRLVAFDLHRSRCGKLPFVARATMCEIRNIS